MKIRVNDRAMFYGARSETFRAAEILRKNMTLPEKIIWKRLKNKELFKTKFRRQHPIDIFIVDFYCHACRLVIEIDGKIHNHEEIKEYDEGRSAELDKFGIKVLRFTNDQVMFNIDSVINEIHKVINELNPPSGDCPWPDALIGPAP
jgi:very-short-patch-repair endonuclease